MDTVVDIFLCSLHDQIRFQCIGSMEIINIYGKLNETCIFVKLKFSDKFCITQKFTFIRLNYCSVCACVCVHIYIFLRSFNDIIFRSMNQIFSFLMTLINGVNDYCTFSVCDFSLYETPEIDKLDKFCSNFVIFIFKNS